ncbi:6455_t:CDS:2 [Cetraspora pellucida]|uniref:6455_t:CDS:1 n=1 Tax=Cetraspora pellucida TaxID=1433469 RepID=A0A9N8Z212_9GLOM|nr:6455_t:CDS:2 [Cetraspora pellucida]
MNFNEKTSAVQETVQNTDMKSESSQEQTTLLREKMQKTTYLTN